jgi:hypothetical protein
VFADARNFIGGSHMLQSNLANAGELQSDYISIGGRTLLLTKFSMKRFRGAPPPHISSAMAIRKVKAHISARSFPWLSQKPGVGGHSRH